MYLVIGMVAILLIVLLALFSLLRSRKYLVAGLSLSVVIASTSLYLYWSDAYHRYIAPSDDAQQTRLLAHFEQHLKDTSASAEGWILLADMYATKKQFTQAIRAYQQAEKLGKISPTAMIEYAEARFLALDQEFDARALELLDEAIALEPNNQKGLWFRGFADFAAEDYDRAIAVWTHLTTLIQDTPEVLIQIEQQIADAKKLRDNTSKAANDDQSITNDNSPDNAQDIDTVMDAIPEPQVPTIYITVSLAEKFIEQISDDDTLFVYARAVVGPPMPLAIKRLQAKDLPLELQLTNDDSMMPSVLMDHFPQVKVVARISRSGQARMQKGDLYGESKAVSPMRNPSVTIKITEMAE